MSTGTWAATDLCSESDVTKWETEVLELLSNASNDYLAIDVDIATTAAPIVTGVSSVEVENGIGVLGVIGKVKTEVTLDGSESLEIKMFDSANNVAFGEINIGSRVYYQAGLGGMTIAAGTTLFNWTIPVGTNDYIKPAIISAAANSGTIDIYTNSYLQDFIDTAKDMVGVELSRMLMNVGLDEWINYSDGDILLDVIDNPEIFKFTAVFKTLELYYQNLTSGNENSPYWNKQRMYHEKYKKQLSREWELKNTDKNLDGTIESYKDETPVITQFSRGGEDQHS